jgi:streptogrisin C
MAGRANTLLTQKRTISISAVIVLLLGFLVIPLVPQKQAIASEERVEDPLVAHLMESRGITAEEAKERIAWQDRASDLYDRLEARLPEDHGGVWIGTDDDRVKVGLVGSKDEVSRTHIAEEVAATALQNAVDYIPVEHSMSELVSVTESLAKMPDWYDAQNKEWQVNMEVIPSRNKVVLRLPPEEIRLTLKQQNFVENAKDKFGSKIEIGRYPGKIVNEACNNYHCDDPLRGGVQILGQQECPSGFIVRGVSSGNRYVLTAGHCLRSGSEGAIHGEFGLDGRYFAKTTTSGELEIGPVTENFYYDFGVDAMIIRRDSFPAWTWTTRGWVFIRPGPGFDGYSGPTYNEQFPVAGAGSNSGLEGQRICKSGQLTGGSCGAIKGVNVWVIDDLGNATSGVVRAYYCSRIGESGAPIVRGGQYRHAMGIHRAGAEQHGDCSQFKYYTGMITILNIFEGRIEVVPEPL